MSERERSAWRLFIAFVCLATGGGGVWSSLEGRPLTHREFAAVALIALGAVLR